MHARKKPKTPRASVFLATNIRADTRLMNGLTGVGDVSYYLDQDHRQRMHRALSLRLVRMVLVHNLGHCQNDDSESLFLLAGLSTEPPRKRSEGETTTDGRSKVVVVEIGDAGAMRNGDGQTAGHEGIRNPGKTVETFGEVVIRIERPLVERARAGTAETGCG